MDGHMDLLSSHDISDRIERDFLKPDNLHLISHLDPVDTGESGLAKAREWTLEQVKSVDDRLSIHDFRMVGGPSHTNYIFDVVVPPEYPTPHDELIETIRKAVQAGRKPIHLVVTVDDSYAAIPT